MELKAVIIDDDQIAIDTITDIAINHIPQMEILGSAKNVATGITIIRQTNPDLVFLDVNMTDGTGFDLLNNIGDINFKIIFITAYNEYALQAIKFSALDYLLKPIDKEDVIRAVNKLEGFREKENYNIKLEAFFKNMTPSVKGTRRLVLNSTESIDVIDIQDIVRCKALNNYTEFYLADGRKIVSSKTLKIYDKLLSCEGFYRLHLSHLVNLRYIHKIDKKNGNLMIMKDKSIVPVSVSNKEELIRLLESL